MGRVGGVGKCGRKLSYVATVQCNGNLLIGKAYTALPDLKPGDEFEIKLGRKQVRLTPVGATDETTSDSTFESSATPANTGFFSCLEEDGSH